MSLNTMSEVTVPVGCISVGEISIDVEGYFLRRGDSIVRLEPRSWDVLLYLVRHPGKLVGKQELVDEVWRGAVVSDAAVSQAVLRVRSALGDSSKAPTYVETVPRKGYRLIAEVVLDKDTRIEPEQNLIPLVAGYPFASQNIAGQLVGRVNELAQLFRLWQRVQRGEPRVVFVEGEAGIGKSELVRAFVNRIREDLGNEGLFSAKTFCAEHVGENEAYLPVYELLSRFEVGRSETTDLAKRVAPSWFDGKNMADHLKNSQSLENNKPLIREIAQLISALARVRPCVITVEDVQWSDDASLGLLEKLLGHLDVGDRVMLLITHRNQAGEPNRNAQVLRRLSALPNCSSLELEPLREEESRMLVATRLEIDLKQAQRLARVVWHWAGGNPFYASSLIDYLVENKYDESIQQGWLDSSEALPLPASLVEAIGVKCGAFSEVQRKLLAVASVVGMKFSLPQLARLHNYHRCDEDSLDSELQVLVDAKVLRWLPPTVGRKVFMRFSHGLYRQVVYNRIRESERSQLHNEIGLHMETVEDKNQKQVAAALGHHFCAAGLPVKAIPYLKLAARKMRYQGAESHAGVYIRKIIELLPEVDDVVFREQEELSSRVELLGSALQTSGDFDMDAEVARIIELAMRPTAPGNLFALVNRVLRSAFMTARFDLARPLVELLGFLSSRPQSAWEQMTTEYAQGCVLHIRGEIKESEACLLRAETMLLQNNVGMHSAEGPFGLRMYSLLAWTALFRGDTERATSLIGRVCFDQSAQDPSARAVVLNSRASMNMLLGNFDRLETDLELLEGLSKDLDQLSMVRAASFLRFWLQMNRGENPPEDAKLERMWLDYVREPQMSRLPLCALALIDGLVIGGRFALALRVLDQAIAAHEQIGFQRDVPELLRLQVSVWLAQQEAETLQVGQTNTNPRPDVMHVAGGSQVVELARTHGGGCEINPVRCEQVPVTLARAQLMARNQGNILWLGRIERTQKWAKSLGYD